MTSKIDDHDRERGSAGRVFTRARARVCILAGYSLGELEKGSAGSSISRWICEPGLIGKD